MGASCAFERAEVAGIVLYHASSTGMVQGATEEPSRRGCITARHLALQGHCQEGNREIRAECEVMSCFMFERVDEDVRSARWLGEAVGWLLG